MYSAKACKWMGTRCSKTVSTFLLVVCLSVPLSAQEKDPSVDDPVRQHYGVPPSAEMYRNAGLTDMTEEEQKEAEKLFEQLAQAAGLNDEDPTAAQADLKIKLLSTPDDAVRAAVADLAALKQAVEAQSDVEFDGTPYRYIWVPDGNPEDLALVSFVLNSAVSRSDINYTPNRQNSPIQFVADGKLVRVNLAVLCPLNQGNDLLEVQEVWDKMFNPYFLLEKQESTRTVTKTIQKKVPVEPYVANDGKTYDFKIQEVEVKTEEKIFAKDRVFGPHIDVDLGAALKTITAAQNPIVWCSTLYHQALSTADGGLYYEFIGVGKAPEPDKGEKKLTDEESWLAGLGVSKELISQLRSDQRAIMTRSNVTAKPRRVDVFNRPSRSSNNQGMIVITQDMFDADYNTAADPLLNLLEFKVSGSEAIYERNNGHLAYLLFDGEGNLVDEAPPQLVSDHTIPAPHTSRLQGAISCIRCHGKGEDQGWKPFENHVRKALNGFLNVYNDRGGEQQKLTVPETLEKLARLYAADLDKPFRRGREDHTDAIVRCTAGVVQNEDGSPWNFRNISEALAERYVYYTYSPVTTLKACREMGYEVDDAEAAVTLINRLLGFLAPDGDTNVVPEDIRLGLLKMNIPINRFQWELVYVDAMTRANINSQQLKQVNPQQQPAAKPQEEQ